ncbi:uncharacterized protein EDB93DRAFT_1184180 [Suillus bovinus]|uniref:uncharacterized protein n=1 Tax=Suillus bovinus TaxID=48563 RepID=UPI001B8799DE|nr:uncharacterized protein EDB93DRAFT_1184180 [Suillus bovinus]KAG2128658.1 hypothetical protein EDB93DRAFT_1184180 [Suillus bovinus]
MNLTLGVSLWPSSSAVFSHSPRCSTSEDTCRIAVVINCSILVLAGSTCHRPLTREKLLVLDVQTTFGHGCRPSQLLAFTVVGLHGR